MLEAIAKLNEQPSRPRLSARVGIDSGTVVVGAGAGKDAEVFGDVPNIAARVQSATEPDTVLITASAHRLISGSSSSKVPVHGTSKASLHRLSSSVSYDRLASADASVLHEDSRRSWAARKSLQLC